VPPRSSFLYLVIPPGVLTPSPLSRLGMLLEQVDYCAYTEVCGRSRLCGGRKPYDLLAAAQQVIVYPKVVDYVRVIAPADMQTQMPTTMPDHSFRRSRAERVHARLDDRLPAPREPVGVQPATAIVTVSPSFDREALIRRRPRRGRPPAGRPVGPG
jgi:hypothetical protein